MLTNSSEQKYNNPLTLHILQVMRYFIPSFECSFIDKFIDYIIKYPGVSIFDAYNYATRGNFANVEEPKKSYLLALHDITNKVAQWKVKLS